MNKTWAWIVGGIVALLVVGGVVLFLVVDTAEEVVALAAEGGEIQLREPMRPIRGEERVLIFALDGVGVEAFMDAVRSGRAPHTAALLGPELGDGLFGQGYVVPDALTILPSTTMAAWASVFTGKPVSETGVSGNEWYERENLRFYAPGPISVEEHEHALQMYTESLVSERIMVPTLYELVDVRSHVSLQMVHRGADLLTVPTVSDVASLFGAVATGITEEDGVEREPYATLDTESVDRLLQSIERHGLPDLQVVYLGGIDLYTHLAENALDEKQRYYFDIVDPAVGRVLEAYRQAGALERTYVLFVSDHGHTPVLAEERHALGTEGEDNPPHLIEQVGFRVRPFVLNLEEDEEDYQAVLAYQGAMAYVYLADRSTCPNPGDRCSWMLPPRLEEDVLPLVRAFDRANRTGDIVPELQGTLDLIFAREPRPVGEDALPFQVWDGERLVPVGDYLAENPRPDLLDLEARMEALSAGPFGHRAGDVLLLARSGMNRPITDRYYFSHLYRSWHGSPEARDSRMTFAVAQHAGSGAELRERLRGVAGDTPSQLDVVPLVRALLDR